MSAQIGKILICLSLIILVAYWTTEKTLQASYQKAARTVCETVQENYYRQNEPIVQAWVGQCLELSKHLPHFYDKAKFIRYMNARLELLQVSHLTIYQPEENTQLWSNEGVDTGIRARQIDDALVVYKVVPGSAADLQGLQLGDRILSVDERPILVSNDVQSLSGNYLIERNQQKFKFVIEASNISENLGPQLYPLSKDIAVVELGSFLPQYFEKETWQQFASELSKFPQLIVDLRGNSGGSFPAMLRAASTLKCGASLLGTLVQGSPEKEIQEEDLEDKLTAESQLEQLFEARKLNLRTSFDYGCYHGRVIALIDSGTSSTAEIFAEALMRRPHTRVWGTVSAGQVVMAQWFPISILGGEDYSMSVPIAGYITATGQELESQGLEPQKHLVYELRRALDGHDSWLDEATLGIKGL